MQGGLQQLAGQRHPALAYDAGSAGWIPHDPEILSLADPDNDANDLAAPSRSEHLRCLTTPVTHGQSRGQIRGQTPFDRRIPFDRHVWPVIATGMAAFRALSRTSFSRLTSTPRTSSSLRVRDSEMTPAEESPVRAPNAKARRDGVPAHASVARLIHLLPRWRRGLSASDARRLSGKYLKIKRRRDRFKYVTSAVGASLSLLQSGSSDPMWGDTWS